MQRLLCSKSKLSRFSLLCASCCCVVYLSFGNAIFAEDRSNWPNPRELLEAARLNATARPMRLEGRLRNGRDSLPFGLEAVPGRVRYTFPTLGQIFELEFGPSAPVLREIRDGSAMSEVDPSSQIGSTGLAKGELALDFLYWPDALIERQEMVKTRKCYLVRLNAPSRTARHMVVFAWIDQANGAIMRMDGHNWQGKLTRRFEVISAQKSSIGWILKQMRVQIMDPETGKTSRRIYLEITGENREPSTSAPEESDVLSLSLT